VDCERVRGSIARKDAQEPSANFRCGEDFVTIGAADGDEEPIPADVAGVGQAMFW
jgi:hypothetical protein